MILPIAKLGTLALRTLSKPIANRLKKEAGNHQRFRQFIINIAQANHRLTTNVQRRIYGHATDVAIRPLNEDKAVQAAADLLGELFVFTVAGGAVVFEVQRSSRAEARKEEQRRQEIEALKKRDEGLTGEVKALRRKIEEVDHLARRRGLAALLNIKQGQATEDVKLNQLDGCQKPKSLSKTLVIELIAQRLPVNSQGKRCIAHTWSDLTISSENFEA